MANQRSNNNTKAKKAGETGEPPHPFKTGHPYEPTEIVTDRKLDDQVNKMEVDYSALYQLMANAGTPVPPEALLRFRKNQLQLRNADTGQWHPLWLKGNPGEESICIGPGED